MRAVDDGYERARAAWPDLDVPYEAWQHRVEAACPEGTSRAELIADDLYLALGCELGDPGALAAFEARHFPTVRSVLQRLSRSQDFVDRAEQELRYQLFVERPAGPPGIATYLGRAPLPAWLRTTTVRLGLALRRKEDSGSDPSWSGSELVSGLVEPDFGVDLVAHRKDVAAALKHAISRLSPRQRSVLSLRYIDGLPGRQLAAVLGVHESTVSRWLDTTRKIVLSTALEQLRGRWQLSSRGTQQIVADLLSQLDVSLRRWLDQGEKAAPLP